MQITNLLFTCELPSGRGSNIWRTGEERSSAARGTCVLVAAPGSRELKSSWRKRWSLVGCFCFCALWSGALLLSADGQNTSAAEIGSKSTSEQLVASKIERVEPAPAEEAFKTEKLGSDAAMLAAVGDSQQQGQKKNQSTTTAAANLNDGTHSARDTHREGQERPNPEKDDSSFGQLDVPAAAAAAAEFQTEKKAQRTGKGNEDVAYAQGPTESRREEGQSKQTQEGLGSGESKVKTSTAAVAKDPDPEQEKEGKEAATKTRTPATPLRGGTTSKETSEDGNSVATGVAVLGSATANEVGPDVMAQCTLGDAHTIFWRARVKSGSVNSPLFTNNAEEVTESVGLYGPTNPFYETLLSCGRSTAAQKDLAEVCIQTRLEQLQREPLTKGCVACFTESVSCGADNCRSSCFLDACAEKCIQCTNEHCRPALERCAGLGRLPPVCVPEEATTSQEEDEEKVDESRQQKAWNTFFHRFTETEDETH